MRFTKKRSQQLIVTALSALTALAAQQAMAQQQIQTTKAQKEPDIDRILVVGHTEKYQVSETNTATKLPLSLKDTPHAITVFTRERIEDFNLITIAEVMEQTPGITIQSYDSNRTRFQARGFTVTNFQLDGIPSNFNVGASGNSIMSDTSVYERVEVVRGAAGLVTGTGDPSATVNLVRKRPGYDFSANTNLTLGSWDYQRAEVDLGGPLTDSGALRGRFVGAYTDRGSYVNYQKDSSPSLYGVMEADLTDSTRIRFGVDQLSTDSKGGAWSATPLFFTDGTATDLSRSWSGGAKWNRWERDNTNAFIVAEQELGDWAGRFAYNKRWTDTRSLLMAGSNSQTFPDKTTGLGLYLVDTFSVGETTEESFDGYLTGPLALFGREHQAMLGANYYDQQQDTMATSLQRNYGLPTKGTAILFPSIYDWDGDITAPTVSERGFPSRVVNGDQSGVYGAIKLNPLDKLDILLGGRYTEVKTVTDNFSTSTNPALAGTLTSTAEVSDDQFTPYTGLMYQLTDQISAFASYAEVFSPQSVRDINDQQLDPLTATNYEFGLKGGFYDDQLYLALSGFRMLQDNVAERIDGADPLPDGSTPYRQVDGISTKGAELEVSGALSPQWNITGGYTYVSSKNADGSRYSTDTAKHLLKLNTTYQLDNWMLGGGVTVQSDISRLMAIPTGAFKADGSPVTATGLAKQGGYTLLDLMLRYNLSKDLSLSGNFTNVLDKKYYRNIGFFNGGYYGQPARVLVSLRWKY